MKSIHFSIVLLGILGTIYPDVYGQTDPTQVKGQLIIEKRSINYNTDNVSPGTGNAIMENLEKIQEVAVQNPLFRPPVGFNASVSRWLSKPPSTLPWQQQPSGNVLIGLPGLYFDNTTKTIKVDEGVGADLQITINSFANLYNDSYSHDLAITNYSCPIFFFMDKKDLVDSTSEYYEYKFGGTGNRHTLYIRAITNGKPLFVPFTREQYLQFKIQQDKFNLANAKKGYDHDAKNVDDIKASLAKDQREPNQTPSIKAQINIYSMQINNWQPILKSENETLTGLQQKLDKHQQQLNSLGSGERKSPAYIVFGGAGNADNMEELTSPEDKNGLELWTINPDYFNKNLPLSAIQLITVKPEAASIAPVFLKDKIMEVYKAVDYQKLEALIRH